GFAEHVAAALGREKGPEAPPIRPVARRDQGLPLSFAQQRLWFIDHFEPGSALYNVPAAVRLKGRLDPAALGRALSEIVRRHEVLRTTFATAGGEPVQVVGPARALPLPLCDLAGLAASDREAVARGLVLAEAGRPFDLARGPGRRVEACRPRRRLGARLLLSCYGARRDLDALPARRAHELLQPGPHHRTAGEIEGLPGLLAHQTIALDPPRGLRQAAQVDQRPGQLGIRA
ncbi:MAG: hypothetical protein GY849_22345, partial [Deltaproteobacteria bacterium]|nr:hypothetical protein [Deltaproteobacteria bacterium]